MSKVHQAIALATQCHFNQNRKYEMDGHYLPYLTHPLEVLKVIWKWGVADETMSCAAILHDAIEDAGSEEKADIFGQIIKKLDEKVYQLVLQLTRPATTPKSKYLESFTKPEVSIEALVIKLADRMCNYLDFLLFDEDYAIKYLRKADVLDEALRNRADEITNKWDEFVMRAIVLSWRDAQLDCDWRDFELSKSQAATALVKYGIL